MKDQRQHPKNVQTHALARKRDGTFHQRFAKRGLTGSYYVKRTYLNGVLQSIRIVLEAEERSG